MKKILISLMAILSGLVYSHNVNGQTEVQSATLQQGAKTTVFYGEYAFVNAFTAVTAKTDVITLSAGSFRTTTLNKACIIYGAGCERDDVKKLYPTVIDDTRVLHGTEKNSDDGSAANKQGDLDDLYIEGCEILNLYFGFESNSVTISNLTLKKCKFKQLAFDRHHFSEPDVKSITTNTRIINCTITESMGLNNEPNNFSIQNSIIQEFKFEEASISCLIKNCVLFSYRFPHCTYKDNIFLRDDVYPLHPSSYCENNISNDAEAFNLLTPANNINNWPDKNDISIFGEEVGDSYNSSKTYAIKPEMASTYLGTDGTPVGLYGGAYPFTKIPSTPQIISKQIDAKSTEDGKLKISIKVEAQK